MVEGARLESVYAGNRIEGSNPSPSAKNEFFVLQHWHCHLYLDCEQSQTIEEDWL